MTGKKKSLKKVPYMPVDGFHYSDARPSTCGGLFHLMCLECGWHAICKPKLIALTVDAHNRHCECRQPKKKTA